MNCLQRSLRVKAVALCLALLAVLICCAPLLAQAAQATLLREGDAALTVGDRATLTLEVRHAADTVAILPTLGEAGAWGDFELVSTEPPSVNPNDDGSLTTRQSFVVTLFAPGLFTTPQLAVRMTDRSGVTYEVAPPPLTLTVDSVLTEPDPALRDLKAQAEVRAMGWLGPVLGLVALALAGAGGWWLWRRGAVGGLRPSTAMDRALAELNKLAAAGLAEQGKFKELSIGISQTVRKYLARELAIEVEDRTTRELRAQLRRTPLSAPAARRLLELLAECDLVKFSEATPTVEGAHALIDEAKEVVREVSGARHAPATEGAAPAQAAAGGRP